MAHWAYYSHMDAPSQTMEITQSPHTRQHQWPNFERDCKHKSNSVTLPSTTSILSYLPTRLLHSSLSNLTTTRTYPADLAQSQFTSPLSKQNYATHNDSRSSSTIFDINICIITSSLLHSQFHCSSRK